MSNARSLANFGGIVSDLTGEVKMWPLTTAPKGYLICNGQAVRRADYPTLYATIGTTFGAGDGASTFNVPNYTDRMPVGKGTIASTIGSIGGSKDAIAVAHTHTFSGSTGGQSASHSHSTGDTYNTHGFIAGGGNAFSKVGLTGQTGGASNDHSHSFSGTTASSGSSGTNANLPPYMGINFIIKY